MYSNSRPEGLTHIFGSSFLIPRHSLQVRKYGPYWLLWMFGSTPYCLWPEYLHERCAQTRNQSSSHLSLKGITDTLQRKLISATCVHDLIISFSEALPTRSDQPLLSVTPLQGFPALWQSLQWSQTSRIGPICIYTDRKLQHSSS